jgi:hypothetical protein
MTAAERRGAAGRDHGPVGRAMASHPRACAGQIRRWLEAGGQAELKPPRTNHNHQFFFLFFLLLLFFFLRE